MLKFIGWTLLALFVAGALLVTIVPRFMNRVYHRGPATDHFDGERFFNPDGDEDTARPPGPGGRGSFFWRYLTGSDGRPPWPASVAVAPAKPEQLLQPFLPPPVYVPATPDQIARTPMVATWIGHATVLVQTPGLNILTDPIWSAKAGPLGLGPRRVAAPGISFDDLPKIDVILLSHNHYDHMDLTTLKRLWKRDRPMIVTSLGNDAILRSKGIEARAADWGEVIVVARQAGVGSNSFSPDPVKIVVTRNHHWGSRWFTDRNRALWSSFVVTLPGGNLFFAGDTGFGDGEWPVEAASHGPIRLALLPIGAFRFAPGQMGSGSHIGPVDAVEVFRRTGATTAIPIHWGTFRLSYEAYDTPPRLLAEAMRATGQTGFAPVAIGRPFTVPPLGRRAPVAPVPRAELLRRLSTPAVEAMR
ncbi:MBL fold metallo-hydrolase [uncultured Sphingomonas sp.]|uniref:MBL fold metallo-hydrolase n=1 Tax=uncultured Sphingomonas sp. TaxID=158754 RepID=UPI0035CAE08D